MPSMLGNFFRSTLVLRRGIKGCWRKESGEKRVEKRGGEEQEESKEEEDNLKVLFQYPCKASRP